MAGELTRRDFLKVAGTSVAGAAMLGAAGCGVAEQGATQGSPGSFKAENVVVVIIDSLRRDHIGAYGNRWIQTPNLDALAAESLRFERAYPESTPTIVARRAIHTGTRTFPFGDWDRRKGNRSPVYGWQHIPEDQTTLAEILQGNDFTTMLVTDVPHEFRPSMNFTRGFGFSDWIRGQERDFYRPSWFASEEELGTFMLRGPGGEPLISKGPGSGTLSWELRQYLANVGQDRSEEDYFASRVFRTAGNFLEGVREQGPFFMVVDCFDPHEPWILPEGYANLYDSGYNGPEPVSPAYGDSGYLSDRELTRMRALYAGGVTMTDRWLGHFLEKAEKTGILDDTAILLLSDHGHALGEHGAVGKPPYALWPEMLDVPFMIRPPGGLGSAKSSNYYASTHDVAPTVLSLLGLDKHPQMEGNDLSPALADREPDPRPYFTMGFSNYVASSDGRYALICRNDGKKAKLYDLQTDPAQNNNILDKERREARRLYEYVLQDAGTPRLPTYDV